MLASCSPHNFKLVEGFGAEKAFDYTSPTAAEDIRAYTANSLEYVMDIDFWQAIRGTQTRLNITRYEVCDTCHGTGSTGSGEVTCPQCKGSGNVTQMAGAMKFSLTCPKCGGSGKLRNACPTCGGDGRVTRTETVDVRIPPGAKRGAYRVDKASPDDDHDTIMIIIRILIMTVSTGA